MPGIVLIHHSSLAPTQSSAQRCDAFFCRPITDDFCFGWVHPCKFVHETCKPSCLTTNWSPCVIPETRCSSCRKRFFELRSNCYPLTFEVFLPTLPGAVCLTWCVSTIQFPSVDARFVFHWQTYQHKVSELLRENSHVTRRCACE